MSKMPTFITILVCLLLSSLSSAQNEKDHSLQEYRDYLRLHDDEFYSGFWAKAIVKTPQDWGQEGKYSSEIEITGNGSIFALETTKTDYGDFSNLKKTQYIESTDHAGFRFTHNSGKHIFINEKSKVVRVDSKKIEVVSGKVVKSEPQKPRIDKYPQESADADNLLYRHLLTVGRGYSRLVSHFEKASFQGDGTLRIEGQGQLFSTQNGRWLLDIDTQNGYIVRKATFTLDGKEAPLLVSETKGVVDSQLGVAESGTFALGDYEIAVKLLDFKRTVDDSVIADVQKAVAIGPPQAFVMDFNLVDSDGMPLVIKDDPTASKDIVGELEKIDLQVAAKSSPSPKATSTPPYNEQSPPQENTQKQDIEEDSSDASRSKWLLAVVFLCVVMAGSVFYFRRKK